VEADKVRQPEEIPDWAGLEGDMDEWEGWTVSPWCGNASLP